MTTLTAPLPLDASRTAGIGGCTLEQRLDDAWQELHGHDVAACPVCDDRMALIADAGRCNGCGSELR